MTKSKSSASSLNVPSIFVTPFSGCCIFLNATRVAWTAMTLISTPAKIEASL